MILNFTIHGKDFRSFFRIHYNILILFVAPLQSLENWFTQFLFYKVMHQKRKSCLDHIVSLLISVYLFTI